MRFEAAIGVAFIFAIPVVYSMLSWSACGECPQDICQEERGLTLLAGFGLGGIAVAVISLMEEVRR